MQWRLWGYPLFATFFAVVVECLFSCTIYHIGDMITQENIGLYGETLSRIFLFWVWESRPIWSGMFRGITHFRVIPLWALGGERPSLFPYYEWLPCDRILILGIIQNANGNLTPDPTRRQILEWKRQMLRLKSWWSRSLGSRSLGTNYDDH